MNPAITTSNLSHFFGKRHVLRHVSFSVGKGDFFIIIGPKGSGKTTLMKLMAGVLKPQQGQIEILGRPNRNQPPPPSWGYEDGPWKGPGPPLLAVADF
jgi:ABC-type multidrug transport system ATPase subunit